MFTPLVQLFWCDTGGDGSDGGHVPCARHGSGLAVPGTQEHNLLLAHLLPELIDLCLREERRQMDLVSAGGVQGCRGTLGDELRN